MAARMYRVVGAPGCPPGRPFVVKARKVSKGVIAWFGGVYPRPHVLPEALLAPPSPLSPPDLPPSPVRRHAGGHGRLCPDVEHDLGSGVHSLRSPPAPDPPTRTRRFVRCGSIYPASGSRGRGPQGLEP